VTFTEPARPGSPGQRLGQRTLVTQVWYPRARGAAGPFPLLLFAPGFLQCPGAYAHCSRRAAPIPSTLPGRAFSFTAPTAPGPGTTWICSVPATWFR